MPCPHRALIPRQIVGTRQEKTLTLATKLTDAVSLPGVEKPLYLMDLQHQGWVKNP